MPDRTLIARSAVRLKPTYAFALYNLGQVLESLYGGDLFEEVQQLYIKVGHEERTLYWIE